MAEQRVNALGQTVEYNKNTDRWEPVKEDVNSVHDADTAAETSAPVPTDEETVVNEGEATPRRARRTE